jgi:hypothetical protein
VRAELRWLDKFEREPEEASSFGIFFAPARIQGKSNCWI